MYRGREGSVYNGKCSAYEMKYEHRNFSGAIKINFIRWGKFERICISVALETFDSEADCKTGKAHERGENSWYVLIPTYKDVK